MTVREYLLSSCAILLLKHKNTVLTLTVCIYVASRMRSIAKCDIASDDSSDGALSQSCTNGPRYVILDRFLDKF